MTRQARWSSEQNNSKIYSAQGNQSAAQTLLSQLPTKPSTFDFSANANFVEKGIMYVTDAAIAYFTKVEH
jgi:hypothetical protein